MFLRFAIKRSLILEWTRGYIARKGDTLQFNFIKENPGYQETETDIVLILDTFHEIKSNLAKHE